LCNYARDDSNDRRWAFQCVIESLSFCSARQSKLAHSLRCCYSVSENNDTNRRLRFYVGEDRNDCSVISSTNEKWWSERRMFSIFRTSGRRWGRFLTEISAHSCLVVSLKSHQTLQMLLLLPCVALFFDVLFMMFNFLLSRNKGYGRYSIFL
jgi:hypothetical protein